jgi:hypothetical protein
VNPLDPSTLEQLARVVCDDNGPHYREYWELEKFFANAGWHVPDYDNSGRERWTRELLLSRHDEPEAIAQVIRRLADPREYPRDPDGAADVAEQLNRLLSFEGLRVAYQRGRPVLVECEPVFRTPAATAPVSLRADLGEIIPDSPMTELLRRRLDEARTCREYGAHLSSVIMLGSVLEGVLREVALRRQSEACRCRQAPKDKNGNPRPIPHWKLAELIDVAHGCGWIHLDVQRFSHKLRDYRNMVHPAVEQADEHHPDEDTANICWNVVVASLNDLADV